MEVRGRGRGGRVRACVRDCVLLFGVCVCVAFLFYFACKYIVYCIIVVCFRSNDYDNCVERREREREGGRVR